MTVALRDHYGGVSCNHTPISHSRERAEAIVADVARKHRTSLERLLAKGTARSISWPRHEAMDRIRIELHWSLPMIGRLFNCHHTTALYGIGAHRARIARV